MAVRCVGQPLPSAPASGVAHWGRQSECSRIHADQLCAAHAADPPGSVYDSQPRVISNLVADQSTTNPAATAAANATPGAELTTSPGLDGVFGTADDTQTYFIPNVAPDGGLSAPFNSWFTMFGQFFDHGLDLINKGGNGTVRILLKFDDPLYERGADNIAGTLDDLGRT